MKVNDAIWGALLLALAAVLLVHIQGFPTIPGQKYGPALMPGVVAVGLAVCGALLIVKGLAVRRARESLHWVEFDEWISSSRRVVALALTVGVNVFYILVVDWLGFMLTGVIYLSVLFWVFGVRAKWIVPIALLVTLAIHYAFYKLLRVPLPWGILQGIAW